MRIYTVKSDYSDVPLAEIREAGGACEFTVDNTDGALPAQVGKSFDKLRQIIAGSSHMHLDEPKGPTAQLLRYELSNGDIIEITTDIKTVILNGRLLSDAEKRAILTAIQAREIQVTRRADPMAPVPVLPTPKRQEATPETPSALNREVIDEIHQSRAERAHEASKHSSDEDPQIDGADMPGMDPLQAAHCRNIWYYFRYGKFKGEHDAG